MSRAMQRPIKEVVHEDALKVEGSTRAPDYCFRIGGAVDMNGRIVWAVTEEEDGAMKEKIKKAFGKK